MQTRTLGSWQLTNYAVGSIVEGKVVRMVPFGAFVELEPGVDGLVHISQIANKHVVKPEDELKVGEIINVKVLEVNSDQKKSAFPRDRQMLLWKKLPQQNNPVCKSSHCGVTMVGVFC